MGGGLGLLLLLVSVLALRCDGQLSRKREYKTRKLPKLDVCGKSEQILDQKIINGKPAELGEFPWMASIGYSRRRVGGTPIWMCGGSLITDQYVITAAHCVHPSTLRNRTNPYYVTKVRLGDLNLNPNYTDHATPIDFDPDTIIWHDYNPNTGENDIALIKLKDKVNFTALIRPICLPPPQFHENLYVGSYTVVAGWGKSVLRQYPPRETRLLKVEVQIQDPESCRRNYTARSVLTHSSAQVIDHRVICASSPGKDACKGDSGGPLMYLMDVKKGDADRFGNTFLMGTVAYGFGCAIEGYPGVYMRVSEYMGWIMDNLDI